MGPKCDLRAVVWCGVYDATTTTTTTTMEFPPFFCATLDFSFFVWMIVIINHFRAPEPPRRARATPTGPACEDTFPPPFFFSAPFRRLGGDLRTTAGAMMTLFSSGFAPTRFLPPFFFTDRFFLLPPRLLFFFFFVLRHVVDDSRWCGFWRPLALKY